MLSSLQNNDPWPQDLIYMCVYMCVCAIPSTWTLINLTGHCWTTRTQTHTHTHTLWVSCRIQETFSGSKGNTERQKNICVSHTGVEWGKLHWVNIFSLPHSFFNKTKHFSSKPQYHIFRCQGDSLDSGTEFTLYSIQTLQETPTSNSILWYHSHTSRDQHEFNSTTCQKIRYEHSDFKRPVRLLQNLLRTNQVAGGPNRNRWLTWCVLLSLVVCEQRPEVVRSDRQAFLLHRLHQLDRQSCRERCHKRQTKHFGLRSFI